jgi:hypothetical protein
LDATDGRLDLDFRRQEMPHRSGDVQLLLAGLLVFFVGCSSSPETVQNKQKSIHVTLPSEWETAVLPGVPGAFIQAKRPSRNAYATVDAQAKKELSHKSVREFADAIIGLEAQNRELSNRKVYPLKALKIKGADAVQCEMHATVRGANIQYLFTFIETPNYWAQVMEWASPNDWYDVQDDFRAIYESLAEVAKSP